MITHLDFELSSICNAGCPVCSRRIYGSFNPFEQTYWKFEDIKRVVGVDLVKQLKFFNVCGNFGDGMGNPDIVKVAEWVKLNNPECEFHISTNGGIGDTTQYKKLAELDVRITFGIDGYGDKNELYRINAKWDKVYENFKTFSKYKKHTDQRFTIQFLLWDQTRDQIEQIVKLAEESNITHLHLLKPFTQHSGYTRGFSMKGEYTHSLTLTEDPIIDTLNRVWAKEEFSVLKEIIKESKLKTHPLVLEPDGHLLKVLPHKIKNFIPKDPKFNEEELVKINSINKQSCYSFNSKNTDDLTQEYNNLYITYNGYLMPCCMIPPLYSFKLNHSTDDESPYQIEILNSVTEIGIEQFSLKNKTIQEVYNSGVLHKFVYDKFKSNSQFSFCKTTCGKCIPLI